MRGLCVSLAVASLAALGIAVGALSSATAVPSRIAYSDLNGDLFVATPQATGAKTLFTSSGSTVTGALGLSPDGTKVLVVESGATQALALVPVAGGTPAVIAGTDGADSGGLSPDGTRVVFSEAPALPASALPGSTRSLFRAARRSRS